MKFCALFCLIATSGFIALWAQTTPSANPSRELGQPQFMLATSTENFVEGQEFTNPQTVAVDTSVTPSPVYVSDTFNNRILAWKDSSHLSNGALADLVIGQTDFYSTTAQGAANPGSLPSSGMADPTGLAVDSSGNLYVADSGNNRILRFPKPFAQTGQVLADLEIGQKGFTTGTANNGGITASSLAFSSASGVFDVKLTFDASGNLYVADTLNNRVLRYPVAKLCSGCNGPAADVVLGQTNFTTGAYVNPTNSQTDGSVLLQPAGVAIDPGGRLFVSDALNRISVFVPPFTSGQAATRFLGLPTVSLGVTPPPDSVFNQPEGLFMVGSSLGVTDVGNNRILLFAPFDNWTSDTGAQDATSVIGQADFTTSLANRGQTEPSADTLFAPFGATFANGSIYAADSGNNRVLVFPQQGSSFTSASVVLGQVGFNYNGVNLVDNHGFDFQNSGASEAGVVADLHSTTPHLYVADTFNNRVLGYSDVRKLQSGAAADLVIGQPDFSHRLANAPGEGITPGDQGLSSPTGLLVDKNGDLYVADSGNGRVLRFASPFTSGQNFPHANLVIGQSSFTLKITDITQRTMSEPYGLAFTFNGSLLVSDILANRVLLFPGPTSSFTNGMAATTVLGQPNYSGNTAGSGPNQMNQPRHISTDVDDRLYVADTLNSRIQIFERVPTASPGAPPVLILTSAGSGSDLNTPHAVYVNTVTQEIWVGDTGNGRMLRFPSFDTLTLNTAANYIFTEFPPLGVTLDSFGDLFVAESINRVGVFYPALADATGVPSVVNAASFLPVTVQALAPGTISAVFAPAHVQFGTTASAKGLPLLTTLSDMQVVVNGTAACLFYVSPGQINFVIPLNAPKAGTTEVDVVRASTGQILGSIPIPMKDVSPGIFVLKGTQAAVVNQDLSINGTDHPAPTGSVISIYATGEGVVSGEPTDCSGATTASATDQKPSVLIGTAQFVGPDNVLYSGLAPGLIGVWQINVKIPKTVPPSSSTGGTTPLVILFKDGISNIPGSINTTIVVKAS